MLSSLVGRTLGRTCGIRSVVKSQLWIQGKPFSLLSYRLMWWTKGCMPFHPRWWWRSAPCFTSARSSQWGSPKTKYSVIEKECLDIKWEGLTLWHYLPGCPLTPCFNHALLQLLHCMPTCGSVTGIWFFSHLIFQWSTGQGCRGWWQITLSWDVVSCRPDGSLDWVRRWGYVWCKTAGMEWWMSNRVALISVTGVVQLYRAIIWWVALVKLKVFY